MQVMGGHPAEGPWINSRDTRTEDLSQFVLPLNLHCFMSWSSTSVDVKIINYLIGSSRALLWVIFETSPPVALASILKSSCRRT